MAVGPTSQILPGLSMLGANPSKYASALKQSHQDFHNCRKHEAISAVLSRINYPREALPAPLEKGVLLSGS